MKIVLLAAESAGIRALRLIHRRGDEVVAVLTPESVADSATASLADTARTLGYPALRPELATHADFAIRIRDLGADILLNVHSLYVVDPAVVAAPALGSFNLHPGPLPEMAGLNAPSWAVYLQKDRHAVTLHWMSAGIDTGPIAFIDRFDIGDDDTGLSVSNKCVSRGIALIERLLDVAADDGASIPSVPQDSSKRKLFRRSDIPNGGRIDWTAGARQITAFVRAADYGPFPSPWGCPRAKLGDLSFGISRARISAGTAEARPGQVLEAQGAKVLVAASDGIVAIEKVILDGGSRDASDVLKAGQILT